MENASNNGAQTYTLFSQFSYNLIIFEEQVHANHLTSPYCISRIKRSIN